MISGANSSGAVQFIDALVNEKGSKMIAFRPKSPRSARGGRLLLIRMFDWRNFQEWAVVGNLDSETYPPNVAVH